MGIQPSQKYMFIPVTGPTVKRGGSLWLGADGVTGFSMTVSTTNTLAGAFRFYMSDDQRARQDASLADQAAAKWTEFTSTLTSQIVNPAGGPTDFNVMVSDFRAGFLRMDFAVTGGTGNVESWYSGVGGG